MSVKRPIKNNNIWSFLVLLVAALLVSAVPILHLPFSWMETFFHEISHGYAAILTGGRISFIELNLDGSGLCGYFGGIREIVAFSGYAGAILWGALIYTIADGISEKTADVIAGILALMIISTAVLWARDIETWIILGVLLIPFVIMIKTKDIPYEQYFLQFCGLYVLLNAIKSPLHLWGYAGKNDAATMSDLLLLPNAVWVAAWCSMGLLTLGYLLRSHMRRSTKV